MHEKPEEKLKGEKLEKFLKTISSNMKKGVLAVSNNYKEGAECLEFSVGNQWSETDKKVRKDANRTWLTINLLHKYLEQVIGEQRKSKMSIVARPKSSADDSELGAIFEGIISGIESNSRAERIYDSAFESQVKCGFGAWRILSRYESWDSFNQENYLELVENPFAIISDPDTRDVNGLDKQWCFVLSKMSKEEYENEYPDSPIHKNWPEYVGTGMQWEHWWDGESVTKAEYYVREKEEFEIALLSTGDEMKLEEAEEELEKHNKLRQKLIDAKASGELPEPQASVMPPMPGQPPMGGMPGTMPPSAPPPGVDAGGPPAMPIGSPPGGAAMPGMPKPSESIGVAPAPGAIPDEVKIVKTRKTEKWRVKRYVVTVGAILEDVQEIPGEYIPIVQVYGKRTNIQGKRHIYGLIQYAKDPQRLFNYQITTAAEVTRLTPKAPYLVTPKEIEGFEDIWARSGSDNVAYLPHNVDEAHPSGPRREPPVQLGELMSQVGITAEFIKNTIGSFNQSGAPSRDQSGEALRILEEGADNSTFSFIDNLAAGVEATGIILLSQIPKVYDTDRDVKITMPNGMESFVPVNTTADKALRKMVDKSGRYSSLDQKKIARKYRKSPLAKFNSLEDGNFSVRVTVGPSYSRQRREVVDVLLKVGQYYPPIAQLAGDIIAQNLNIPEHMVEELTRRLRKVLPPGIVPPDPNSQPMPPNPQAIAQMKAVEAETMKAQAAMKKAYVAAEKVKADSAVKMAEIQSKEKLASDKLAHEGQRHAVEMDAEKQALIQEAYMKLHEIFGKQKGAAGSSPPPIT